MNTPAPFPDQGPSLKLPPRAEAPTGAGPSGDAQWQMRMDLEELRARESNLREYEARLRAWQEQLAGAGPVAVRPRSASPFAGAATPFSPPDDFEVRSGWEKLHRARALLEAEQHQTRDERLTLRASEAQLAVREAELNRREAELSRRETAVAPREQGRAESAAGGEDGRTVSAVRRLTQSPFQAARAVFKSAK